MGLQARLQFAQLDGWRIVRRKLEPVFNVCHDGIESTGGVIGRTAIGNARQSLGAHLRPQPLDEGRLANTGLAADEDHLPQPGFALLPAAAQQPAFFLSPHQHRHRGRHKFLVMAGCHQQATHPADHHRLCDPMEGVGSQVFQRKRPVHQACRHGANHHGIGRSEGLSRAARLGVSPSARCSCRPHRSHHPHHDGAGVDAQPYSEPDVILRRHAGVQDGDGLDNAQARVDGTPGIVFMGRGVAEIDQQPITEVLGDIACVVLDDLSAASWSSAHHRAEVFRVELAGERRGALVLNSTVSCRRSASAAI